MAFSQKFINEAQALIKQRTTFDREAQYALECLKDLIDPNLKNVDTARFLWEIRNATNIDARFGALWHNNVRELDPSGKYQKPLSGDMEEGFAMPLSKEFKDDARKLLRQEANTLGLGTAGDIIRSFSETGTMHVWSTLQELVDGPLLRDDQIAEKLGEIKRVKGQDLRLEKLWEDHASELNGKLREHGKAAFRMTKEA